MDPFVLPDPITSLPSIYDYQSPQDTSALSSPAAANSPDFLTSLANGVGQLFDNGLNVYASVTNRLRALNILGANTTTTPASTTTAATPAATNDKILTIVLLLVAVVIFFWLVRSFKK